MKKTVAFTLAEVLVTLMIVGVIAAMTIPGMKEHSDERIYVVQAKKAQATANAATVALEAKFGDAQFWSEWSNAAALNTKYKSVMNTLVKPVEVYPTSTLNGTPWSTLGGEDYFQTTDGMIWYVYNYKNAQGSLGVIHVDTNGPSAPNKIGVDVLGFVVAKDGGVFPLNDGVHDINVAWACVYYMIKYEKMPWLTDPSYANCSDSRIQK